MSVLRFEMKSEARRTDCIVPAVGQDLDSRDPSCDRIRKGGIMCIEAVDTPEPWQNWPIGRVEFQSSCSDRRTDNPCAGMQVDCTQIKTSQALLSSTKMKRQ